MKLGFLAEKFLRGLAYGGKIAQVELQEYRVAAGELLEVRDGLCRLRLASCRHVHLRIAAQERLGICLVSVHRESRYSKALTLTVSLPMPVLEPVRNAVIHCVVARSSYLRTSDNDDFARQVGNLVRREVGCRRLDGSNGPSNGCSGFAHFLGKYRLEEVDGDVEKSLGLLLDHYLLSVCSYTPHCSAPSGHERLATSIKCT